MLLRADLTIAPIFARMKYLGLAAVFPIPFALGYGEPVVPFVVAGVVTSGTGLALERITARWPGRVGIREGFLVVALVWLLAAGFAAIPYLFQGGAQLSSPLDAYFEGMRTSDAWATVKESVAPSE